MRQNNPIPWPLILVFRDKKPQECAWGLPAKGFSRFPRASDPVFSVLFGIQPR
jgi:hypothetical protein